MPILLIAACLLPLLGTARDETLEERKRRIMRKYLRENTTTVQSGILVPVEESPETDQTLDSKRFSEVEVDIARHEGAVVPPPMPRRPVPSAEDRNWLLSEDAGANDPFADPYSTETKTGTEKSPLSEWEYKPEDRTRQTPQTDWTKSREDGSRGSVLFGNRTSGSSSILSPDDAAYGNRPSALQFYQNNQQERSPLDLQSPFSRFPTGTERDSRTFGSENRTFGSDGRTFGSDGLDQRQQGYTPRSLPYQSGMNRTAPPIVTPAPSFERTDPYQKWKQNKQAPLDPMRDDAFLNEHMPKFGN